MVRDNLRNCTVAGFGSEESELPAILRLEPRRGGRAGQDRDRPTHGEADLERASPDPGGRRAVVMTARGQAAQRRAAASPSCSTTPRWGRCCGRGPQRSAVVGPNRRRGRLGAGVPGRHGRGPALRRRPAETGRHGDGHGRQGRGPGRRRPRAAAAPVPARPPRRCSDRLRRPTAGRGPGPVRARPNATLGPDGDGKPQVSRLSADKVLWQVPCGGGAYNFDSLFVIDKAGRERLGAAGRRRRRPGHQRRATTPGPGVLSAYNKGRGIGDCGERHPVAWTGRGLRNCSEATVMPVCRYGYDWPTVFHAEVRELGPGI